jgi:hypothetical protein
MWTSVNFWTEVPPLYFFNHKRNTIYDTKLTTGTKNKGVKTHGGKNVFTLLNLKAKKVVKKMA